MCIRNAFNRVVDSVDNGIGSVTRSIATRLRSDECRYDADLYPILESMSREELIELSLPMCEKWSSQMYAHDVADIERISDEILRYGSHTFSSMRTYREILVYGYNEDKTKYVYTSNGIGYARRPANVSEEDSLTTLHVRIFQAWMTQSQKRVQSNSEIQQLIKDGYGMTDEDIQSFLGVDFYSLTNEEVLESLHHPRLFSEQGSVGEAIKGAGKAGFFYIGGHTFPFAFYTGLMSLTAKSVGAISIAATGSGLSLATNAAINHWAKVALGTPMVIIGTLWAGYDIQKPAKALLRDTLRRLSLSYLMDINE